MRALISPWSTHTYLDRSGITNIKEFEYHEDKAFGKTIVRGHYPQPLTKIKDALHSGQKIISLDNGCVYPDRLDQGNLLCLDLDHRELIVQKNIEGN